MVQASFTKNHAAGAAWFIRIYRKLTEFGKVLDRPDHLAGVGVFVVVPGDDLDLSLIHILLANPSNPTGYILSPEEMRLLADIAIENDLYLIADEVYREFAYGERMPESFSKFKDLEQHLVLVDSASKRFSACGARIGALLTKNEALMAQMMKLAQCLSLIHI